MPGLPPAGGGAGLPLPPVPHDEGTELDAHPGGECPPRALAAVRNAAYDHVRSTADSGVPLLRSNCSERAPLVPMRA